MYICICVFFSMHDIFECPYDTVQDVFLYIHMYLRDIKHVSRSQMSPINVLNGMVESRSYCNDCRNEIYNYCKVFLNV